MGKIHFLKKIDWKYGLLLLGVMGAGYASYHYQGFIIEQATAFFKIKNLNFKAGGFAIAIMIVHKIKSKKFNFTSNMSFNDFKLPLEEIMSFVMGSPVTLICSISLAKGLFLQWNDNMDYFPKFESWELTFIGLVTAYLAFISVMGLVKDIGHIFTLKKSNSVKPKPADEDEIKDNPVPEPAS